ncbi:MAG: hypothetical protein ABIP49_05900 [Lysobacterales bacterium]
MAAMPDFSYGLLFAARAGAEPSKAATSAEARANRCVVSIPEVIGQAPCDGG